MIISIEGILKVIGLFILALITGWTPIWIIFWIMFITVTIGHIWMFFHPKPTVESKIKALRALLEDSTENQHK